MNRTIAKRLAVLVTITAASVAGFSATSDAAEVPHPTSAVVTAAPMGTFDGVWAMAQSNDLVVRLNLGAPDAGGAFTGTADFGGGSGGVTGKLTGDDVVFEIQWGFGRIGRYTGHLGTDGRWSGDSVDLTEPSSHAQWWARRV